MKRVCIRFERIIRYVTEYYDRNNRYPTTAEISGSFRVGQRAAQKMLRRFFNELGE